MGHLVERTLNSVPFLTGNQRGDASRCMHHFLHVDYMNHVYYQANITAPSMCQHIAKYHIWIFKKGSIWMYLTLLLCRGWNEQNRCLSVLTPRLSEMRARKRSGGGGGGGACHVSDHPVTHYLHSGKKLRFSVFRQLCFTITHTEFLLCWHIWNYCRASQTTQNDRTP